jgi:sporadic carbohydrate cluster protein (TIGR04323 family)
MSEPILYVNTRLACGVAIPLPLQTSYLRDYCKRRGFRFSLPMAEYGFGNSYPALTKILHRKNATILISTSLILPQASTFDWSSFVAHSECNSQFHLVMERQVCSLVGLANRMIKSTLQSEILDRSAHQLDQVPELLF